MRISDWSSDVCSSDLELSTSENDAQSATEKISTDDCAQVAAMIKAVELRTEPVQCEFEPLLPDEAGSACGEGFKTTSVFDETFDEGLGDWTQTEELAEGAQRGFAWEPSNQAPDHEGGRSEEDTSELQSLMRISYA